MEEQLDAFIDTEAIAEYLGCAVRHVRAMCKNGTLRHIRIGGRGQIRSKRSWIDQMEAANGGVETVRMQ